MQSTFLHYSSDSVHVPEESNTDSEHHVAVKHNDSFDHVPESFNNEARHVPEVFRNDGKYSKNRYQRRLQKAFSLGSWQSVDYEDIDSDVKACYHRQVTQENHGNTGTKFFTTQFYTVFSQLLVAGLIGLLAGLYYIGMYKITTLWFELRLQWIEPLIGHPLRLFGILLIPSIAMSLIAFGLTIWEPTAAGSGMPEVIAYLNGIERSRFLSWRTLVTKALGTICVVNSGLFSGYDGPLIHISVLLALVVTRNVKKVKFLAQWLHGHMNEELDRNKSIMCAARNRNLQLFGTIGAAAGVAAAFESPLAGVTFAIEEAISFYDPRLIAKALFACSMAIVGSSLAHFKSGETGLYDSTYAVNVQCDINLLGIDYIVYILLGIIGGVTGHFYNVLVANVRIYRQKYIQTSLWKRLAEVVTVVILTNAVIVLFLYGPYFSEASRLAQNGRLSCTSFETAVQHINTIPSSSVCRMTCREFTASNFDLIPCENYVETLCVVRGVKSALETFLVESVSRANTTCASPNNADTFLDLLPNNRSLGFIFNESTRVPLPSDLYDSAKFSSGRPGSSEESASCYYQTASLILNKPSGILTNLFLRGYYYLFEASILALFLLIYIVMSVLVHHITMPTDLVLPTLVIGATMGRLFGEIFNMILLTIGWQGQLMDPGATALLGLCAFWSGTSRLMITIIVIAVQNTGELTYINGVTLIVIIASFLGNQLGPSQFHLDLETDQVPFLPHHAPYDFKSVTIHDMLKHLYQKHGKINQVWDIPLSKEFTVAEASDLLRDEPRNEKDPNHRPPPFGYSGFPVVNHLGQLQGLLLRSQLERIVSMYAPTAYISPSLHRGSVFLERPNALSSFESKWRRNQFPTHARQPNTSMASQKEELQRSLVSEVTMQMNRSPTTVHPEYSVEKAYNIFRQLGLRHLMVVNQSNDVMAILTRRDFANLIEDFHHGHGPSVHQPGHGEVSKSIPPGDGYKSPSTIIQLYQDPNINSQRRSLSRRTVRRRLPMEAPEPDLPMPLSPTE